MYFNINQLPTFTFCGPHSKPHGAKGLRKHYHFCFDTKLVNDVCVILRIPCACVSCTSVKEKNRVYGIPSNKQ